MSTTASGQTKKYTKGMRRFNLFILAGILFIGYFILIGWKAWRIPLNFYPKVSNSIVSSSPTTSSTASDTTPSPSSFSTIVAPIADFKSRITKKFFGTYITPSNSPVYPERFTGYHTGVDVEYTDVSSDVPVYAITDGTIVTSEYASGYGGVLVLQTTINSLVRYVVYGHLRRGSMPANGTQVKQNEQLGVLGTGYSSETDGERRHLHFGVATKNTIAGYVPSLSLLHASWIDPLSLY